MLAVAWVDWNRQCFVLRVCKTTTGDKQVRIRWRKGYSASTHERQFVAKPSLLNNYYSSARMIYTHNRMQKDNIAQEKSIQVKERSMWVNSSLLEIGETGHLFDVSRWIWFSINKTWSWIFLRPHRAPYWQHIWCDRDTNTACTAIGRR